MRNLLQLNAPKVFLILLVLGFVTFANGLRNPMVIDDHAFFDEKMRNLKYMWIQFVPDKDVALQIKDRQTDAYYRPLAHVIPMLSYAAFRSNVFGHHALNTILLVLACFMIALFVYFVWKDWRLGLVAAIGYLVHPINGVMVNYITASVFSAQVVFMLSSLILILTADGKPWRTAASIIFFLLSLMCHETAFGLPLYAVTLYMICRGKSWKRALHGTWPLWAFAVVYFIFRLKFASLHDSILGNFVKFHMSIFEYLASMAKLVVWYLAKLFYPVGIVLIKASPVVREYVWLWFLAGLGILTAFAAGMRFYRDQPAALLGLVWFFIGFIPFTQACLFRPSHGLMLEPHWFIFPLVGFFIWLAAVGTNIWQRHKNYLVAGVAAVVLASWVVISWGMNRVWGDEIRYCHYWLSQSPGFSAVMFYLGKAYEIRKDYPNARVYYEQSLKSDYKKDLILTNIGLIDIVESKWGQAKDHLSRALQYNPYVETAWSNLGTVAFVEGDYDKAIGYFQKAMAINPFAMLPRLNLAKTFEKIGRIDEAIAVYEELLKRLPNDEIILVNALKLHHTRQDKDKLMATAQKLMSISGNPETLTNVGIIMEQLSRRDLARAAYQKSIAIDRQYIKARQLLQRLERL